MKFSGTTNKKRLIIFSKKNFIILVNIFQQFFLSLEETELFYFFLLSISFYLHNSNSLFKVRNNIM